MKDPDKVLLPSRNLILVALREDEPGERLPFTLLDDPLLDIGHGSAIETSVSGIRWLGVRIVGLAHVIKSPIASRTAWVSSSNCLPFNLR
jgi:hypothetical protein